MDEFVSPDELHRQLASSTPLTVIDVRSAADTLPQRLAELPGDRPAVPY